MTLIIIIVSNNCYYYFYNYIIVTSIHEISIQYYKQHLTVLQPRIGNTIPVIIYYPGIARFFKVYFGILVPGLGNRKFP